MPPITTKLNSEKGTINVKNLQSIRMEYDKKGSFLNVVKNDNADPNSVKISDKDHSYSNNKFTIAACHYDALTKLMELDGNPNDLSINDLKNANKLKGSLFKSIDISRVEKEGVLTLQLKDYEFCGGTERTLVIDLKTDAEMTEKTPPKQSSQEKEEPNLLIQIWNKFFN